MKSTFNILYTPGSVRYLSWFALSLLKWSRTDVSYRLISNGCLPEEEALLEALCARNERFLFMKLPSPETLRHAHALNALQALEDSDTFCFLDSDILATGDFLAELGPLSGAAAVCSGHAIWTTRRERLASSRARILRGSHHAAGNWCLGSTFFAIYDNRFLKHVIAKYGVGFDRYRHWKGIPLSARRALLRLGFGPKTYDTGKVLNILLQAEGGRVVYKDCDFLVHIGGLSKRSRGNQQNQHDLLWYLQRGNWRGFLEASTNWRDWPLLNRKAQISRYFTDYLDALVNGASFESRLRVWEPEIRREVLASSASIREYHTELRTSSTALNEPQHV